MRSKTSAITDTTAVPALIHLADTRRGGREGGQAACRGFVTGKYYVYRLDGWQ